MRVTKLDAAQRQLDTAIGLWIEDQDPVSIHTLAYAAHQIVHDLNRANGGPPLLLDSPSIKPESRNEFIYLMKMHPNFFKHADGRGKNKGSDPEEVEFEPSVNDGFILITIHGLEQLQRQLTDYEKAFKLWQQINKPELFKAAWQDVIKTPTLSEKIKAMRKVPKKTFFKFVFEAQATLDKDTTPNGV